MGVYNQSSKHLVGMHHGSMVVKAVRGILGLTELKAENSPYAPDSGSGEVSLA